MLRLALASPPLTGSIETAMPWAERFIAEAAAVKADVVCFPETFIPGLRGPDYEVEPHDPAGLRQALDRVCVSARDHAVCVVMPMEWPGRDGILNLAFVVSAEGEVLGSQTKNQLDPSEDAYYVPGSGRALFEIKGVPFGIAICHEGWRYPETVRWAAVRGARVVFHPNVAGNDRFSAKLERWGDPDSPYYEKAMTCRALENAVWFASVNNALAYQEAATAVIAPDGTCLAHGAYGKPGLIVCDIDPEAATGLYAARFAADTYRDPA